jgi:hypothetical protein
MKFFLLYRKLFKLLIFASLLVSMVILYISQVGMVSFWILFEYG